METPEEFEKASHRRGASLVKEFLQFVVENKAWWLIPILVCLGGLGILVALSSTVAAPFIYTLF